MIGKPKLNVNDIIDAYGIKVIVSENSKNGDCNECEIHDKCNRDYFHLKSLCKVYGAKNCEELIGIDRHFKIVKDQ